MTVMAGLRDVAQIRQGLDVFHLECEEVRMIVLLVRATQRRSPISTKEAAVYCCCC